jgi:hypothetical protein
MANVYAVNTGNWSDTTVWNTGALPTSADDVFANNFTVTIDVDFTTLSLRNEAATGIISGGGFILNSERTITCTGLGIRNAGTTCVTFSSTGTSYINSNITNNGQSNCVNITSTGTLYIVGEITTTAGNGVAAINATTAASSIYITGNVRVASFGGARCIILQNNATAYITGNVTMIAAGNANRAVFLNAGGRVIVTGNVFYESTASNNSGIIESNATSYINVVGTVSSINTNQDNNGSPAIINSVLNTLSLNFFSGPLISSVYGIVAVQVSRFYLIKTFGTYYEFRDSTTNGALYPFTPAPATRLVSPDTVVDAPLQKDVREGVSYSLGTYVGTLKVPSPNQVAFGIPTDNTTGVALLTGDSWIAAISSSNDPFAERLRNLATVQTTAAQIAAF